MFFGFLNKYKQQKKMHAYNQAVAELSPIRIVIVKGAVKRYGINRMLKEIAKVSNSKNLSATFHTNVSLLREAGWNIGLQDGQYVLKSFVANDGTVFTW